MKRRGDIVITIASLALLIVVGIVAYIQRKTPVTPYASDSAASNGTLALYRWVAALGYRPRRLTSSPLPLGKIQALIVLEPQAGFSPAEVDTTLRWVQRGGTLIVLEDGGNEALLARLHLFITQIPRSPISTLFSPSSAAYGAAPLQPVLAHPPLRGLSITLAYAIHGSDPAVVPVLGNGGVRPPSATAKAHVAQPDPKEPILVYERFGKGQVYAGSVPDAVTNGLIATGDNRRLIPNLLAALRPGDGVGFDDYHLHPPAAPSASQPVTLNDVLYATGWGRALLYALILIGVYIILSGRRLGRPLRPLPERGRSLSEYVVSMAAIFRRAGVRSRVLRLWQDQLRRTLAGEGKLRGRGDADLVAAAAARAGLTVEQQQEILSLLQPREQLSEATLVDLCRRIARVEQLLS